MVRVRYARSNNGQFAARSYGLGGREFEEAYPPPSVVADTPFANAPVLAEAPDLRGARSVSVGWRQTLHVTPQCAVLESWNGRNNDYRVLERSPAVEDWVRSAFRDAVL